MEHLTCDYNARAIFERIEVHMRKFHHLSSPRGELCLYGSFRIGLDILDEPYLKVIDVPITNRE